MSWHEPITCSICGDTGNVKLALISWLDAPAGMTYEWADKCVDEAACRARYESAGKSWPLRPRAVG